MATFSDFDQRRYRTVDVRASYGEWVATYEDTVQDAMDLDLLENLHSVPWSSLHHAVDLGCGTGRTGAWLAQRGLTAIDGVDLTPEMLARARDKGVYRRLVEGDLLASGLAAETYDLATVCLVDEHLADLRPLYREAYRLATPGGFLVLVAYHPHFMMASGMPTHYTRTSGEPVAIETHLHLLSDHVAAALAAGWVLTELQERLIDDGWLRLKPKWAPLRGHPITAAFVWAKPALSPGDGSSALSGDSPTTTPKHRAT